MELAKSLAFASSSKIPQRPLPPSAAPSVAAALPAADVKDASAGDDTTAAAGQLTMKNAKGT
jgi:hypothetical protein